MSNGTTDSGRQKLLRRVQHCLAWRYVPLVAVALGLLLTAASVRNGLEADDYYHRTVLTGQGHFAQILGGPQDMMRFLPADPERTRVLLERGFLPWWAYPGARAEFLQFLTVQTHILDYHLWPRHPEWMHLHNLAWFAMLLLLAAVLYRRLLGATWMAGAAALLFAVEDAHGTPAGWICNRNILLAASFGFACLIAHDVWRRGKHPLGLPTALLFWACSLCSKEAGIATCAYLGAYAFWLDEAPLLRRLTTLVPYGLVLVAWRVVRDSLGYGVADLGLYVDPLTDPPRFLAALIERYPVFLLGQWGLPPSDVSVLVTRLLGSPLWWWSMAFVAGLAIVFWPVLRRDRLARFFATGMLLAVIPICATFPTDRLLMFVGLGATGLLVRFVYFAFGSETKPGAGRKVAATAAVGLLLLHAGLAPLFLALRATAPTGPRWLVERLYIRMPFDATIEQQDLIVINPPSVLHASYCLVLRDFEGEPVPRSVRTLAPALGPVTIHRPDSNTLEIAPQDGYFVLALDRLFRNEQHRLQIGDRVDLPRMTARVVSVTEDGRPAIVTFRFAVPLEDPSLRWIQWRGDGFAPFTPPAVGEQIELGPR